MEIFLYDMCYIVLDFKGYFNLTPKINTILYGSVLVPEAFSVTVQDNSSNNSTWQGRPFLHALHSPAEPT